MEEMKKPAIRFEGFTEDWEKKPLSAFSNKVSEKNTNNQYTETFTNSAEFGVISQRDFFDHDISNAENINGYYIVKSDDFVYNPRISVTAPCGPINRNKLGRSGVMSPLYTVFRTNDVNKLFLEWYFKSDYWHSYMYFNGDSGARSDRFSIKNDLFFQMPIPVPSTEEQQQIGFALDEINDTITLHQQKYDKLLTFKKSMLEKLFPQNGAKVPEVRFAGFDGEWERRKFRDLYEPVTQKNDLTYGINDNITVASMQYKTDIKVTDEDYLRTYNVFLLGDIAFEGHQSKEFRYGRFVENDIGNGIVSHIFTVFRPKCEYDLSYWKYAINNEKLMRPILACCTKASTMMNDLVAKDFLDSCILVPTIEEQQKIGTFLKSLDELVSLYSAELEKLKKIKSALLEKMFV